MSAPESVYAVTFEQCCCEFGDQKKADPYRTFATGTIYYIWGKK